MRRIICSIYFTLISLIVCAQIEKIDTDRSGETNNPNTVPQKKMQFETRFLNQSDKITATHKDIFIQHPSLLTKYGIGNRLELRMILDIATLKEQTINSNSSLTGINNFQLGGKLNFFKEKGLRPNTSIVAHYRFNRLKIFSARYDTIDGGNFRFVMKHNLSESFSIGYNLGMDWRSFDSDPAYIYTFSPKFNINESWQVFIEVYGYAWKKRTPQNSIDGGISYFINNNFKIDASAGFGLNKNAPDKFYAIGASFRFKTGK